MAAINPTVADATARVTPSTLDLWPPANLHKKIGYLLIHKRKNITKPVDILIMVNYMTKIPDSGRALKNA